MAITIDNSANITYEYGTSTDYALSNIATTSLTENYSLSAQKLSNNTNWRPSENLTFLIQITNTGTEPLYAVSIQDNLGSNTSDKPLVYVENSAKLFKNDTITQINPTNEVPLTIEIPNTLEPNETVIISYIAKVRSDIDNSIIVITNTATVVGHETSVSGPIVTANPSPVLELPKTSYAEVRITKTVDKETIAVNEPLTYTFRLENSGNMEAENVVIQDILPEKFIIQSITSLTGGMTTTFEQADYSLDENNKLILPTSVTKTISVPERTSSGNGVTIVTITGQIND